MASSAKSRSPARVICFSKDRPFQLKEYLRSFLLHCADAVDVCVLYKDSERFSKSYALVRQMFPKVSFVEETAFYDQFVRLIADASSHYVHLDVDDSLYYREFSMLDSIRALEDRQVMNFQWGMHPGCTQAQTQGWIDIKRPEFEDRGEFLTWFRAAGTGSWSWPFKLTASVYRKIFVLEILTTIDPSVITIPNTLERGVVHLLGRGEMFQERPLSACPKRAVSSCLAVNRVQQQFRSPIEGNESELASCQLDRFLFEGREMDLEYYRNQTFNSSHIGDFVLK